MPGQKLKVQHQSISLQKYYPEASLLDDSESDGSEEPDVDRSSNVEQFETESDATDLADTDEESEDGDVYVTESESSAEEGDGEEEADESMLDVDDLDFNDIDKLVTHYADGLPPDLNVDYQHRCIVCDKPDGKVCPGCNAIYYCSVDHQKEDWALHSQLCKRHGSLETPRNGTMRAVLLPMGAVVPKDRVKPKYLLVTYKAEQLRNRRYGYTELTVSEADVANAIQVQGGAVTEVMRWSEHPETGRKLSKDIRVMSCANYKGTGRVRYLLLTVQRNMTPKELRETYGEGNVEEHWNPRTYDTGPEEVSLAVAWLKERYQR